MSNPFKHNASAMNELRTLEFTSRQLIFVICMLLVLAAGLIVVGIQIGRWETANQNLQNEKNIASVRNESDAESLGEGQGRQLSPRTSTQTSKEMSPQNKTPGYVESPAPPPISAPASGNSTAPQSQLKSDQIPSPESSGQPLQQGQNPVEVSVINDKPETKSASVINRETDQGKKPDPASIPEKKNTAQDSQQSTTKLDLERTTPLTVFPEPTEETQNADTLTTVATHVPSSGYAVQIAAIPSSRKQEAEQYLKKIAHLNPYIKPSEDNKFLRVLVGNFPDKAGAEQKCSELKKTKEFAGCFVRKL